MSAKRAGGHHCQRNGEQSRGEHSAVIPPWRGCGTEGHTFEHKVREAKHTAGRSATGRRSLRDRNGLYLGAREYQNCSALALWHESPLCDVRRGKPQESELPLPDFANPSLTASATTSESPAARLSLLLPSTYGFTNWELISLTVCPTGCNSRAQDCALPHASMPMRQAGCCASVSRNLLRLTRFWIIMRPRSSMPRSWKTCFARSILGVIHFVVDLSLSLL